MKRTIFLFLSLLLLTGVLTACSGKEEAASPTEPTSGAPRPSAPQLNYDDDDVKNVNDWILENYGNNVKGEVTWNVVSGQDTACALIICLTEETTGQRHYTVSNFDGITGMEIDNEQILTQLNMKESQFLSLARTSAAEQFYAKNGLEKGMGYDERLADKIEDELNHTINKEHFSTDMPMFLDAEGQLCIVTQIGSVTDEPANAEIIPVAVPKAWPVYELYSPYAEEAVLVPQISSDSKDAKKINETIMKAYKDAEDPLTELSWTAADVEERLLSLVLYRTEEETTQASMVCNFDLEKEKVIDNEDLLEKMGTTDKDFAYLTKLAAETYYRELWLPKKAAQEISEESFLNGLMSTLYQDFSNEIRQIFLDGEGRLNALTRVADPLTGEFTDVTLPVELRDVTIDPEEPVASPISVNHVDMDGGMWSFWIPQINGDSVDIRRVNKYIMDKYGPIAQAVTEGGDVAAVNEENLREVIWMIKERDARYFSLILSIQSALGSGRYEVYNFDRLTGEQISNEQLIAGAGLNEEEFIVLANDAIDLQYHVYHGGKECESNPEMYEFGVQSYEAMRRRVAGITNKDLPMYMDLYGRLHVAVSIPYDSTENTTQTFATVVRKEIPTDMSDLVSEAYNFEVIGVDGRTHCYNVPQINCDSEDAKRINLEIMEYYGEMARQVQQGEMDGEKTSIAWTLVRNGESRFALIIAHRDSMDHPRYRVYNFDMKTGLQISNAQLFAELDMSEENILPKIKEKVREEYAIRFAELRERDPESYNDRLPWLISNLYIHPDMNLYLNAKGELTAVVAFEIDVESLLVVGKID